MGVRFLSSVSHQPTLEVVHCEPNAFSFRERISCIGVQVKSKTLREKCIVQ